MTKILVADDEVDMELLIKQKFRKQIREGQYEFVFALNGNEALAKLQEHGDVDVALCDINMPEMDGLTLLTKLSEAKPLIKSVIVSAYGDMENIRVAMNRGAFDFICKPVDFEDLRLTMEKTIQYVAQIKETLKAIKENNILKMYVDGTVLNFMNSREFETGLMKNETVEATVAFIDICSFTTISENEPPDNVVKMLNNYFDVMVTEIIKHEGYIDKFIGDAIMAVFRGSYHLDRAVEASLAIRTQVEKIPVESGRINFSPKVSIGINSGEVISGNIGSANLRRLDYTVIGDVVNTAQRLQTAAKEGQVLITESSYKKIKEFFNCIKIGEVSVKNKAHGLMVYEVLN
jgi:class 3 adenylate cyclase/DNA-binding NarL/FixJ family response regulator